MPTDWDWFANNPYDEWIGRREYDRVIAACTEVIRRCTEAAPAARGLRLAWMALRGWWHRTPTIRRTVLARAYRMRAMALLGKGDQGAHVWEGGDEDYGRAIDDSGEAIALWMSFRGKWPRPAGFATELALAYRVRGRALLGRREFDGAIRALGEAARLDPVRAQDPAGEWGLLTPGRIRSCLVDAYDGRGLRRMAERDYAGAIADFDEVLRTEREPEQRAMYLGHRAKALRLLGEYEAAVADLGQAIRLMGRTSYPGPYLECRLAIRLEQGRYDRALAELDETIRLGLGSLDVHILRLEFLAGCPDAGYRDGPRAVEEGRLACERTGWRDPRCLAALAAACAESGDFARAVDYQEKALDSPIAFAYKPEEGRRRLELYRAGRPYRLAAGRP